MLIVTIASLVMAAGLGWFALRLLQEEQRRSEARVSLLTAALEGDSWVPPVEPEQPVRLAPAPAMRVRTPDPVAVATPTLVIVEDDTRSMRRFASELDEPAAAAVLPPTEPVEAPAAAPAPTLAAVTPASEAETRTRASGLFAEVPEARPADARGLIAIGGLVLVGLLAAGYLLFGRPASVDDPATTTEATVATATDTPVAAAPVELVALAHEQRDGRLVVRGIVRNPANGADRQDLQASVMLLDQAGGFLGSGRAPVDTSRLRPGDDAGFAVELTANKDVRRYRVTFRASDGGLVPHADARSTTSAKR